MFRKNLIDLPFLGEDAFGNVKGINLYGVFFAAGVVAALIIVLIYSKKMKMSSDAQSSVYFICIFGIIAGYLSAMLFQSFYNYLESGIFKLQGITFLGGLMGGIGGFCAVFFIAEWLKKKYKFGNSYSKEFWKMTEIMPCAVTLAHSLGRIGCMFGGCCHGAETDSWIGVFSGGYVPVQLFEALFLFALFVFLTWLLFNTSLDINLSVYLISYGVWRIIIELFRTDDRGTFLFNLTPSTFWAIVMVIIGTGLLTAKYLLKKNKGYDLPC